MTPALSGTSLYGGYGDIEVVRGVSVDVHPGKITALMGRNGAGKTTLLRLLSGLSPVGGGRVVIGGRDVTGLRAHRRVGAGLGFVQEGKQIFRERTVEENILLGGYPLGLKRRDRTVLLDEAFARFPGLVAKRDVPAGMLSGGQQQMLAIAQALAARPKVLMLDEPTTGLAPSIVSEVFDLLGALRREGLAVLLVEQVVDLCLTVADEVVVLNLGREAFAGPVGSPGLVSSIEAAYLTGDRA